MITAALLAHAICIASDAHISTTDKGGMPYILHPLRVMMRLRTNDFHTMALAVLHDAVEDGKVTYRQLSAQGFPPDFIADLCLLTHARGDTYEEYVEKMAGNRRVLSVKREDIRDNSDITRLRGLTDKDVERMAKYQRAFVRVQELLKALD